MAKSTLNSARKKIAKLVQRFSRNLASYRDTSYKEAQLRKEFLDPFFEALGWDVSNKQGFAPQYKEVIDEATLRSGGTTTAPDYSFRIGGKRLFFVEAKKPSVGVKENADAAYQLRRYAWSAKLPLSILTDFEEFAVYESRKKPKHSDKASVERIKFLTYDEYPKRLEEIWNVFSKDAVLKGEFDRYAADARKKRGTAEVDKEFLAEIEGWRDALARNIALRNRDLSVHDLNYAVQATIDRILFFRIAEDRGVEDYGRLQALVNGANIYARLTQLYHEADDKYNAGLFDFSSDGDTLTPTLTIDDKVLKDIIGGLYYPDCPYEFSVFPADILGSVYERFLGKVIRLTPGHRAKVEDKPEVKKAGGVYYTPTFIVDYIVKNTVGKWIHGKSPKQIEKLKVLDPACGSGSFLLAAYQMLLDHHLQWYTDHPPRKRIKPIYQVAVDTEGRPSFRLTTQEKKRIILNNIFGVDIDPQAVEVTKLNLLLKVLEGETEETVSRTRRLFHERALPNLDNNIKCGNSLIGPDYWKGRSADLFDQEEVNRINAFDWHAEFPDIMKRGGFDVVIGNPPWGADFHTDEKAYLREHYALNTGKYESYIHFVERAIGSLGKGGFFGFIIPSYWISRSQTDAFRAELRSTMTPLRIVVMPESVFPGVKMDSCMVIAAKRQPRKQERVFVGEVLQSQLDEAMSTNELEARLHEVSLANWKKHIRFPFNPRVSEEDVSIILKAEKLSVPLEQLAEISQGLTLYRRSTLAQRFGKRKADEIISKRLFHSGYRKDASFRKEIGGSDVSRYHVEWDGTSWVSYGPWLAHAVDEKFFKGPRIVIQKLRNPMLTRRLVAGFLDDDDTYSAGTLLNLIMSSKAYDIFYILSLLNSTLMNYWYRKMILDVSIRVIDLRRLPVRRINPSSTEEKRRHDELVSQVDVMLNLHKKLHNARTKHDKEVTQRQIDATNKEIDQLVYELYDLTPEEIRVVEESVH